MEGWAGEGSCRRDSSRTPKVTDRLQGKERGAAGGFLGAPAAWRGVAEPRARGVGEGRGLGLAVPVPASAALLAQELGDKEGGILAGDEASGMPGPDTQAGNQT